MKYLLIDGQIAGASGDMFLGALLDLHYTDIEATADADTKRKELVNKLAEIIPKAAELESEVEITIDLVRKNVRAFEGIMLRIAIKEPHRHLHTHQAFKIIDEAFKLLKFSEKAQEFSRKAVEILLEGEAKAHGVPLAKVHLHEAGSLDTFLDILGTAYLLDQLELFDAKILLLPIATGSGTVSFSHGTLPVPAPAVAEILQKYQLPVRPGTIDCELLTPTGVAIIASLALTAQCAFVEEFPPMIFEKTGIGFGIKEFDKSPNALRLILGSSLAKDYEQEELSIIETNIDDDIGETIGFVTQRLLAIGAKDVFLTPIFMKKGRPGTIISVLCDPKEEEKFASELLKQTSTIGIRITRSSKIMLSREIQEFTININGKKWTIRGKIAHDKKGRIVHFKPEFEDIRTITEETGLSFKEVTQIARETISKELKESLKKKEESDI